MKLTAASLPNFSSSLAIAAAQVGLSRPVFHRKFKQATTMSPNQFVKAMRIAGGKSVNEAAM